MPIPLPEFLALAAACAPVIPPETLTPLIRVESGFDPLAINVNGEPKIKVRARNAGEAVVAARRLIAQGRSVDLGLGQINSANLRWLGLSVEAAFDPCRNLSAAATVLGDGYRRARGGSDPQGALRIAFSYYNTGHPERGFRNGYVAKVMAAASRSSAIAPGAEPPPPTLPPVPPAPSWDVFAQAVRGGSFLIHKPIGEALPAPASGDLR